MNKKKLLVRLILFILVTIVFSSIFYFYFKNSRASSPLQDEKYMEQLNVLSKKYKIVSPTVPTPTLTLSKKSNNQDILTKIVKSITSFFSTLID